MQIKGKKIFIGHGRSPLWRELKDFIHDRLKLIPDEFNLEPVAGKTAKERLLKMLDDACFAFLVLTAEDERSDKTKHARENVVHETGLFQGRLGFEKAIILLESSCEEFSNIFGLQQIPFPDGDISAKFEEIRKVLERESILRSNQARTGESLGLSLSQSRSHDSAHRQTRVDLRRGHR